MYIKTNEKHNEMQNQQKSKYIFNLKITCFLE